MLQNMHASDESSESFSSDKDSRDGHHAVKDS